jgi:adenine-specific DNA-methyltransferase
VRRIIKYLGSKRRLVPVLGEMLSASGASTALDLFTGTTRVAQEFKERGARVTAVDAARYSEVFARCYIATDARSVDVHELDRRLARLNALPGEPGYVTETFCLASRFFRPENGERIDAVRQAIRDDYGDDPVLLTSLIEAADRVDSTTGVQMAYLKQWAPRARNPLELRQPELLDGGGAVRRGDAVQLAAGLGSFDLAYLDPPYNQHRYFTNYHVWETLVAWDSPEAYGIAQKRTDARDESTKSAFNKRREMPDALRRCVEQIDARLLVLSYNDESWIALQELIDMCACRGTVEVLTFDSKRYVGAQIGIHDHTGRRVGKISHLRNTEYVLVCGAAGDVARATGSLRSAHPARRAEESPLRA